MTVLLLSFALSSCLVPQSVEQNATQHTVPIIDLTQLSGALLTPTVPLYLRGPDDIAQQCNCRLELVIPVIKDEDPTIDVQARWFVDYDLGTTLSQSPVQTTDFPGSFTNPSVIRGPVTFTLDADARGLSTGPHVVEMIVAERQGFATDNVDPAHRALVPQFDATTFKV
ncbi:MAG: hypothetical protein ACJ79O_13200, partial [Myxococcales bacterium]